MKRRAMILILVLALAVTTTPYVTAQTTGYWELVDTEAVVPPDYTVGDQSDTRVTKVSYSEGSATITYTRTVYDGIKKVYLNESLVVTGGWSKPPSKVDASQVVTLNLSASIGQFERISINNSGVQVKAYFADLNAPFGRLSTSAGDLTDSSGKALCEAWINDGVIKTASQSKAVSGTFGTGSAGMKKALFVVVRGDKLTGVKYIYEWKADETPPVAPVPDPATPATPETPSAPTEETGQKYVSGTVYFDRDKTKPVPYAAATLLYVDSAGRIVADSGIVYPLDANGNYRIPVDHDVPEGGSLRLSVELVYLRDGILNMQLVFDASGHSGGYRIGSVQSFQRGEEEELFFDFCLLDGFEVFGVEIPSTPDTDLVHLNVAIFEHMVFAYQYFRDDRSLNMNHKLPLIVNAFYYDDRQPTEYYAFLRVSNGDIYLSQGYSDMSEAESEFVFFHEFSHFAMACMYNGLPPLSVGDLNHGGYANRSTSDSLSEGFATFMGMMLYRQLNNSERTIIPMRTDMELNWKVWERRGKAEEYAVAGTLLDLIDKPTRDDDNIALSFGDLWGILEMPMTSVAEFYEKLAGAFEGQQVAIDEVFRNHGLHGANRAGDGIYNQGEAFLDANKSGRWDTGERYVDYSMNEVGKPPRMEYQDGDRIGTASYLSDPERKTTEAFPGCFIKVNNDIPYYLISVAFFDDPLMNYESRTRNDNGLVYVEVPPDEYDCEITILPEGMPDAAPLVFSSWEFQAVYGDAVETGYFIDNAFDVNGNGAGFALTTTVAAEEKATGNGLFLPVAIGIVVLLLAVGAFMIQLKRRA